MHRGSHRRSGVVERVGSHVVEGRGEGRSRLVRREHLRRRGRHKGRLGRVLEGTLRAITTVRVEPVAQGKRRKRERKRADSTS